MITKEKKDAIISPMLNENKTSRYNIQAILEQKILEQQVDTFLLIQTAKERNKKIQKEINKIFEFKK